MWLELPNLWIFVLNVVAIPAIHLAISWLFTRMDRSRFDPSASLYRERSWEKGGAFYQRYLRIRSWKHHLPDAGPWFRGFAKSSLRDRTPAYLRAFIVETCRGEAAHLAQTVALLLTLLWNPWPIAAGVMTAYAILSNLPCVLLQRFTRARLRRVLEELESREKEGSGA